MLNGNTWILRLDNWILLRGLRADVGQSSRDLQICPRARSQLPYRDAHLDHLDNSPKIDQIVKNVEYLLHFSLKGAS